MAGVKKETGPTGRRVATNLKRIRQRRGLSLAELARTLARLGWPLLDTGLLRAETGERRIDVDDLVALAVALGCSPVTLLLPETTPPVPRLTAKVDITPGVRMPTGRAWAWATGEQQLDDAGPRAEAQFVLENHPHRFALEVSHDTTTPWAAMAAIVNAALDKGLTSSQLRTVFEQALTTGLNGIEGDDGTH